MLYQQRHIYVEMEVVLLQLASDYQRFLSLLCHLLQVDEPQVIERLLSSYPFISASEQPRNEDPCLSAEASFNLRRKRDFPFHNVSDGFRVVLRFKRSVAGHQFEDSNS